MINPLTGDPLTEAQIAAARARFAGAADTWTAVLDFARDALSRLDDPLEQYQAIGLHVADVVGRQVPPELPQSQWSDFNCGHMIGILAVAAADTARRAGT